MTAQLGHTYQTRLARSFEGAQRSADLCSYFFRQAFRLLKPSGTAGLIATKSISEGTTRAFGLDHIYAHGGEIYHATRRRAWPGRGAKVKISTVHLYHGVYRGPRCLDGRIVEHIGPTLTERALDAEPKRLDVNRGVAFQGSITLGMGFTFDDRSRRAHPLAHLDQILSVRPSSSEVISPYLGGSELNTNPTHQHHRYVINFGSMTLAEAERWPELVATLRESVYPARIHHKNPVIRAYPWWQHWNRREGLYRAIAGARRVLLTNAQATSHLCFSFYEGEAIFANSINVINLDDWASFALLQSQVHEVWARALSTNLGDQLRYNPTRCFETYPRHAARHASDELIDIGERYHTLRSRLMSDQETRDQLMERSDLEGLTSLYNRLHDPLCDWEGVRRLRTLQREMDRAVVRAFGWTDLELSYIWTDEFSGRPLEMSAQSGSDQRPRLTFTPEVSAELFTRLLALNLSHA